MYINHFFLLLSIKFILIFERLQQMCKWIKKDVYIILGAWVTLFCLKFKLMKEWNDVSIKRSKYTCVEGMLKQDVHICRGFSATSHLCMFICSFNKREWLHMCMYECTNLFHSISFGKSKHLQELYYIFIVCMLSSTHLYARLSCKHIDVD